jgi:hypothetical protein
MSSKKSFNAATVPWYAHPDTKPIRPRAPRPLAEDILQDKIRKGRYIQALYNWVRANWTDGEFFYMLPGAPTHPNYNIGGRFGIFRAMKPQGAMSRIFVEWLDDGHRINPEVTTFYKHAVKLDEQGEPVELPPILVT